MTDLEHMQPVAAALACAVADWDATAVADVLTNLTTTGLYELAVFLAAKVDVDAPLGACTTLEQVHGRAVVYAAAAFGVTVPAVLGRNRQAIVVKARAVAMAVVTRSGATTIEVGRLFDRDHTTVSHHLARVHADAHLTQATENLCDRIFLTSVAA